MHGIKDSMSMCRSRRSRVVTREPSNEVERVPLLPARGRDCCERSYASATVPNCVGCESMSRLCRRLGAASLV